MLVVAEFPFESCYCFLLLLPNVLDFISGPNYEVGCLEFKYVRLIKSLFHAGFEIMQDK